MKIINPKQTTKPINAPVMSLRIRYSRLVVDLAKRAPRQTPVIAQHLPIVSHIKKALSYQLVNEPAKTATATVPAMRRVWLNGAVLRSVGQYHIVKKKPAAATPESTSMYGFPRSDLKGVKKQHTRAAAQARLNWTMTMKRILRAYSRDSVDQVSLSYRSLSEKTLLETWFQFTLETFCCSSSTSGTTDILSFFV